ncbi:glycosyltransferase family 2 protein [Ruegeria marisrubri]|uniref:glycosyltransferase family 2 protein n=1 Tax=Ruegeria marisrubri TaxID=1685379 RepID=UPI000AA1F8B4|nr:glycosyltransferase family 2 protein [Ruegeria marisrubri]
MITVTRNLIEAGRKAAVQETLRCVQSQTFRRMEHVIWDGESTDGTQGLLEDVILDIASTADHIPIRYFCGPDKSLFDAMNKAVDLSAGEYVLFLNSDDLLPGPDCLQQVVNLIGERRPDFIYGETVFVEEDGRKRHARRLTLKSILQRMPFGHNAMLVRAEVFRKLEGHDLQFRSVADYDMILRMIQAGYRSLRVQVPLSVFRKGGVSADTVAAGAEMARCWEKNYARYCDMSAYSHDERVEWYGKGQLPVRLSLAILRQSLTQPLIARAAIYSLSKTLRRSLQPWRKF